MSRLLVIFAGLPSSGKSTLARSLKEYLPSCLPTPCPGILVVDPDLLRGDNPEHLPFNPENEPKIKEKVIQTVTQSLGMGQVTIIDDLNYYQSMRHDLLQVALEADASYVVIHVNTPLEVCKAWNKKRGFKVPDEVLEKVSLKFDYFERYAWDQPDFTIDPSSPTFSGSNFLLQFCGFLKKNIHRRPQLSGAAPIKITQPASIKHQLDVRSRKILSEFLAENAFRSDQKEFLKIRRDLLHKNPANLEETEQLLREFRTILTNKKFNPKEI